ncbi:hypothetical protein BDY21DRAFT_275687, partial [Lineolata rhizophorae]
TNDLRSGAVDYMRDREHKSKWARGETWGPCRTTDDSYGSDGPGGRDASVASGSPPTHDEDMAAVAAAAAASTAATAATGSGDAECDITYSFDAPRGPGHGSTVLSSALSQAIERFENKATDKLVADEYEVLNKEGE